MDVLQIVEELDKNLTDKGYLHFSYGHFFQNPSFSYIYDNPEFEVPAASGVNSTMGNADMEPQRTTQYEVGFSQQFGKDIGLEINRIRFARHQLCL